MIIKKILHLEKIRLTLALIYSITLLVSLSCGINNNDVATDVSKPASEKDSLNLIIAYEETLNNLYNENVTSLVKINIFYPGITDPVTGSGFVNDGNSFDVSPVRSATNFSASPLLANHLFFLFPLTEKVTRYCFVPSSLLGSFIIFIS